MIPVGVRPVVSEGVPLRSGQHPRTQNGIKQDSFVGHGLNLSLSLSSHFELRRETFSERPDNGVGCVSKLLDRGWIVDIICSVLTVSGVHDCTSRRTRAGLTVLPHRGCHSKDFLGVLGMVDDGPRCE
jgi:hypothetical protein